MKVPSPKYYTQKYNVKPHEFRSIVQIMRKTEGVGEDKDARISYRQGKKGIGEVQRREKQALNW